MFSVETGHCEMTEHIAPERLTGLVTSGRGIASGIVRELNGRIFPFLGGEPFPGTLNVAVNAPFLLKGGIQLDDKGKRIAVRARIGNIPCLVYRWNGAPLHIVEVIAPVALRKSLMLSDGQAVDLHVTPGHIERPGRLRTRFWRLFYEGRVQSYYDDHMYSLYTGSGFKFFHKKICQFRSEF